MLIRRTLMVVAVLAATAGCAIEQQDAPGLSGPSEYGLGMEVTATPDLILPQESSLVVVTVRDADGNPLPGVGLRLRVAVGGGTLSANNGVTAANGTLASTYTAPGGDAFVTIEVTTIGTNAQITRTRTVAIRVRS